MGLPEHFSGGAARNPTLSSSLSGAGLTGAGSGGRTLVLLDDTAAESEPRRETLGSQFVFGIVPLTRVYFEHGVQSLVRELTSEILTQEDVVVGEVFKDGAEAAAAVFTPQLILAPHLQGLSTNAYDLLVARYVSVGGELTVDAFASPSDPSPLRRSTAKLNFDEFRRAAQAPVLAYSIEKTIADNLRPMIQEELTRLRQFPRRAAEVANERRWEGNDRQPLLVIPPLSLSPEVQALIAASFGTELSRSYGFQSVPAFTPQMTSRIFTRGLESGARSLSISTLLLSHQLSLPLPGTPPPAFPLWTLRGQIQHLARSLAAPEKISVSMILEIQEQTPASDSGQHREVLRKSLCQATVAIDSRHDGALIVALGEAAAASARAALERDNDIAQCVIG